MLGESPAQSAGGMEGGRVLIPLLRYHFSRRQTPVAQLHAAATVANIEPQRNSFRIHLPEAKSARPCHHPVAVGSVPCRRQEIPGHDAVSVKAAPLQVAVGTLPLTPRNCVLSGSRPNQHKCKRSSRLRGDPTASARVLLVPNCFASAVTSTSSACQRSPDLDSGWRPAPSTYAATKSGCRMISMNVSFVSAAQLPGAWAAATAAMPVSRNALRDLFIRRQTRDSMRLTTVFSALIRAHHFQFPSMIVQGAYSVSVFSNISSSASM